MNLPGRCDSTKGRPYSPHPGISHQIGLFAPLQSHRDAGQLTLSSLKVIFYTEYVRFRLKEFIASVVPAQNSIWCEIGPERARCDETHDLITRSRGSVRAIGIRHVDFACDGRTLHPVRERRRWRSPRKRVRRRGVRGAGEARRLAESRSPRRSSAVGWGEHPGSLCRATNASASGDSNRRTRTGRGADGAR